MAFKVWFNGKILNKEKAKIEILTHSLHYGTSVFEGIRGYKTEKGIAIFRLIDHLERLFYSASVFEMKIPYSKKEIEKATFKLIKINKLKDCYIRPIAFFGEKLGLNPKGTKVNLAIIALPWEGLFKKKKIKVKISKFIRIHPQTTVCEAKISGHYVNSVLATLEAKKSGFDEAILLDFEGKVAEGPGENIFLVKGQELFTPSLGSILPGITRKTVIEIAKDLNLQVREEKIDPQRLKAADEIFFTGTAVEICPIYQVEEKLINGGKIGKITKKIKKFYQRIVRAKEKKYLKWLSFVK